MFLGPSGDQSLPRLDLGAFQKTLLGKGDRIAGQCARAHHRRSNAVVAEEGRLLGAGGISDLEHAAGRLR